MPRTLPGLVARAADGASGEIERQGDPLRGALSSLVAEMRAA